ncbi:MAG: trypsin-like peptidase domain-containing protein [Nitrospirae bacterium]|nr:trypsin-like peptidase domain-containing protein [Nitrospirota bacterium]
MADTSESKYRNNNRNGFEQPRASCPKSFRPWIWTLVLLAVLTLAWAFYESYKEGGIVRNILETDDVSKMVKLKKSSPYDRVALTEPVGQVQTSYHDIIDKVRPAVISIDVVLEPNPQTPVAFQVPELVAIQQPLTYTRVGSGVIVEPTGYVLTSYHVIDGAKTMKGTVYLPGGGKEYKLKVVNVNKDADLALLRLDGEGPFAHADLGDSNAVRTGDVVIALGSPFGFDYSVSVGIISSKNRSITVGGRVYDGLFQTDAALNKGSSGGPLVNVAGEVIAISNAIYSPSGGFTGVGFAIPVSEASQLVAGVVDFNDIVPQVGGQMVAWAKQGKQVGNSYKLPSGMMITPPHPYRGKCLDCHPQLCQFGGGGRLAVQPNKQNQGAVPAALQQDTQATQPFFGALLLDVDSVIATHFNLPHRGGLLVDKVYPGTPAEAAGLKRGDVILRVDGRRLANVAEFKTILADKPAGAKFDLTVATGDTRKTLTMKTIPEPPFLPKMTQATKPIKEFDWLGTEVEPIKPPLSAYVKNGVYVSDAGGVLKAAGVIKGDIITSINNKPVYDMFSFVGITGDVNVKEGFVLDIIRSGQPMFITVKG